MSETTAGTKFGAKFETTAGTKGGTTPTIMKSMGAPRFRFRDFHLVS